MKLKQDFVTNSSSSSFIFVFKGDDKRELFKLIRKYQNRFDLSVDWSYGDYKDFHSVDYKYLVDLLEEHLDKTGKINNNIDELITDNKRQIKYWEKELKNDKKKHSKDSNYDEYWIKRDEKQIEDLKEKVRILEKFKKDDSSYLFIELGDSHGDFSGELPAVFDANREELQFEEEDLCVLTECNH